MAVNRCVEQTSCKRRRVDDQDACLTESVYCNGKMLAAGSTHFFPIRHSNCIFHTEEWKTSGTALFKPLLEDLLINSLKYEQISCSEGDFFIADEQGNYSQTVTGRVLHLWKYDKHEKKLYIARSFLFTNLQEYMTVQQYLQRL